MSTQGTTTREEWPTFALDFQFNPDADEGFPSLAPDDLVVYDPSSRRSSWLTATRGAYLALEDVR
ncbi:hypothetical protein [Halomarina oriensis]|uniref:Uncharacterized protein n=1 Tax=Halomarina oriensis TaxID=671145 RepID=A0A6B0GNP7_9EURY|nr:hypothetical protein [Halomarina oriensis]MWG33218.1 hypothetical protein [Halomarina oriensis]